MGKILKKKVKHSLPIVVIFCLLNILALGFSFNLNFSQNAEKVSVKMSAIGANAADIASTTVTVKNSPPGFTAGPTENPTSTSTTPINVGGNISFEGTGTDGEGNDYWLLICSTNSATTTGAEPTCNGGTQFCVSGQTNSGNPASCSYNGITDPGSEMQEWYAFVCDNHGTDPDCSAGNQGTGVGGSPFYVNHAPHLKRLFTSDDNKDPGTNFTFTASTSDTDALGGYDYISLYVCKSNDWTVNGGCGGTELCHGSSSVAAASSSVSCTFATPVPWMYGSYTYYGFISDWHKMAASVGNGTSTDYNVNNVAPTISYIALNQGNNITLNIKGAGGKLVYATSTSISDNNGCTDLSSATSTTYFSSVSSGPNCAANNNNCYIGECNISGCAGTSTAAATVTCSTTLAFHALPTDDSSTASTSYWLAKIRARDSLGLTGATTTQADIVDVVSSEALEVTETEITYGTVQAGADTGTTNQPTTIVNYGNTPIDTDVTGEDMTRSGGPEIIGIENQEHSLTSGFAWGAGTNTSSTTPDTVDTDIARPTDENDVSDIVYWGIGIPVGTVSDAYEGYNVFTVVLDGNGDWQYP